MSECVNLIANMCQARMIPYLRECETDIYSSKVCRAKTCRSKTVCGSLPKNTVCEAIVCESIVECED